MKKIAVLGITGSIGQQTLEVVLEHSDQFMIVALSAGHNIALLKEILLKCQPELVCLALPTDAFQLKKLYPKLRFVSGESGLIEVATYRKIDLVVNALVGYIGLKPTLAAINAHVDVALANKETLVVGGKYVKEAIKKAGVKLLPIDSEHSAIFQALQGNQVTAINKLIITASGGSLRDKSRDELSLVTKAQALKHPNWSMGAKITIDSATMMNKGLEVIEAHWLFDQDFDNIEVLMHPESIVHSMIEYVDGAIIAQLGSPDMRIPIQYALTYPQRCVSHQNKFLDLSMIGQLNFTKPDFKRYPLLALAYHVGRMQGNLPVIMNAANEEAVHLFLRDQISFLQIEELVMNACSNIPYVKDINLEDIDHYDAIAREYVLKEGASK